MTVDPTTGPLLDPRDLAAQARSVLSCPTAVRLVVDGAPGAGHEPGLGMQDEHGTPTFLCDPAAGLSGCVGREAVLTVHGDLSGDLSGPAAGRGALAVSVAGTLVARGTTVCACCTEERMVLALEPTAVLLDRGEEAAAGQRVRIPVTEFRSASHDLNLGVLRRATAHANDRHGEDLRRSVATSTQTPLEWVLAASLSDLTTSGVTLTWLDHQGAHRRRVVFCRSARSMAELSDLLRRELDTGFC